MLDHTGIVVTDLHTARRFYNAIAEPLGLATSSNSPDSFLFGKSAEEPIPYLWIGTLRPSYWVEGISCRTEPDAHRLRRKKLPDGG